MGPTGGLRKPLEISLGNSPVATAHGDLWTPRCSTVPRGPPTSDSSAALERGSVQKCWDMSNSLKFQKHSGMKQMYVLESVPLRSLRRVWKPLKKPLVNSPARSSLDAAAHEALCFPLCSTVSRGGRLATRAGPTPLVGQYPRGPRLATRAGHSSYGSESLLHLFGHARNYGLEMLPSRRVRTLPQTL